jgi:hypothetical protein
MDMKRKFIQFVLLVKKHLIQQNVRSLLILRILILLHIGRILGKMSSKGLNILLLK